MSKDEVFILFGLVCIAVIVLLTAWVCRAIRSYEIHRQYEMYFGKFNEEEDDG
ncbi:hypothetical protein LCGC14_0251910 [marine sediment metagenome]|uniref:Uncharacterized protein n=1 Tax=marine sediment metagenome TaxID=412755 RepID=A0A0F9U932_9ZZZZ